MARPLRIEYPGAVYHITSRGNARQNIFLCDTDRLTFLKVLSNTIEKYNWLCHGFCLLDNHYHLVIETLDPNLSLGMRQLNGVYTQTFNRAKQRVGHVFQGRYKAILVEKESHLLEVCRYVVLNPVRAGMVSKPAEWEWSSYTSTAFTGTAPKYLCIDWVLRQFSEDKTAARQQYRQFVAEGLQDKQEHFWKKLVGQIILGSEKFVAMLEEHIEDKQEIGEIPRSQRFPGRPSLDRIFAGIANASRQRRKLLIAETHIKYGYTLKEIADFLGIHYTTVSKIVAALRKL
ncbi:REP-associated tyrosine transposase [Desulfopila inferna]|uniref:REP-associated tyrosine transposase n=1 Tax=Desulfopila inferna TaxID=468528 RepID=UPI001963E733|nr:transposase [Desulfopila inferna]MBM9603180.1 transposase [Desulfopila inferna]